VLSTPICPPHQVHQALRHHQADAGALFGTALLSEPVERLEQLGLLRGREPRAGVAHADADRLGCGERALHRHVAARLVVFDGVEQQVDEHLLEPRAVGLHAARLLQPGKDHADAALLRLRLHHGPAFGQHLGQRHRLARQRELAALDEREVQDFVDQLEQVPAGFEDLLDAALLSRRGQPVSCVAGAAFAEWITETKRGLRRVSRVGGHGVSQEPIEKSPACGGALRAFKAR